ncbi:Nucleoside diphosphate-sugar hydrolase of the MutT (NUDIX) family [Handroanthus impetiginosus]|uniref:Nucleoside diphosphate-sugar hydrolase of the MutT (NUDIX) family n=1 Tax=Handroanthus impetiginosus TaxID=429701 RepID=A0A2G9GZM3_9LAMI|nr:Nucleoside diphosphate-sugar hydrolase of the MutT (NUDIX) family [Handroanthus impetiginosus]
MHGVKRVLGEMRTLFLVPAQLLPITRSILDIKIASHPTNWTHFPSVPIRYFHKSTRIFSQKMASEPTSSQLTHTITLPAQLGQPVIILAAAGVSDSDFRHAIECSLFKQWLNNIQTETGLLANGAMSLRQVLIQGVDMFGSRVGFLKFKADVIDKETGKKIPGIVFARGPAVAVLILLDSDGETYAVLTEQVRVPVGKLILELPAGMLDGDKGDIAGTAIREVEEETGLHLNLNDVIDLTAFLDPSTGRRVFPSPGGCDEDIGLFLYRGSVDKEIIRELQGKQTGLRDHGELIRVHVVPFKNLWRMTADAKVLTAIALYEMAKRDGLLPPYKD